MHLDTPPFCRLGRLFTDPPYNVSFGDHGGQQRGAKRRRIANDAMSPEQWGEFCRGWARQLISNVDGAVYVCMSTKEWPTVSRVLDEAGANGAHLGDSSVAASPFAAEHGAQVSQAHRGAVSGALALIPDGASVSAQSGLVARLSQRQEIYEFPRRSDEATWVIVDQRGFRTSQSTAAGCDRALEEVRATHRLVYAVDGVLVFTEQSR
jgi:hypothetical protein